MEAEGRVWRGERGSANEQGSQATKDKCGYWGDSQQGKCLSDECENGTQVKPSMLLTPKLSKRLSVLTGQPA